MYGISGSLFRHTACIATQKKVASMGVTPRTQTGIRPMHTADMSDLQAILGISATTGYMAAITNYIAKDMYHRFSARHTIVPPIPAPRPLVQLSQAETLQRIRSLFSSPDTVSAFHKIIEHMDHSCVGKDPSVWVSGHYCYKVSTIAAVILKHAGFDPRICGVVGSRNDCLGIDHAWVEVPISTQTSASPIVVDLSCRQYTGPFRGETAIEVPHGAIASKPVFFEWVGNAKDNWNSASDLTPGFFKKPITSFEKALYRETSLNKVDIQNVFLGSEDFLYGSQLFLKTRDFLLTFERTGGLGE